MWGIGRLSRCRTPLALSYDVACTPGHHLCSACSCWHATSLPATHTAHPQVALLAACKRRGIPVLASAGAGAKADPTRLRILDVAESVADPLARSVRHR